MIERPPRRSLQISLFPIRVVVAVLVVISEIARPLYRPFVRWISELSVVVHFGDFVASLPRGVILVIFAIPFAIAEPLKIYALVIIAKGHPVVGLAIIVLAYLMSFVLVERIFHAGREKLLTYRWLSWIMERVEVIRAWVAEARARVTSGVRRWLGKPA